MVLNLAAHENHLQSFKNNNAWDISQNYDSVDLGLVLGLCFRSIPGGSEVHGVRTIDLERTQLLFHRLRCHLEIGEVALLLI